MMLYEAVREAAMRVANVGRDTPGAFSNAVSWLSRARQSLDGDVGARDSYRRVAAAELTRDLREEGYRALSGLAEWLAANDRAET